MQEYLLEKVDQATDRRVRKTKKALRAALFSLIQEKPINKITVKEITELADVNRSTFYLYYTDVYNMYENIQDEIYNLFSAYIMPSKASILNPEDFVQHCKRFLIFCKENPETCRFVMRNETNNQLAKRIKESIMDNYPDSHKFYPIEDPRHHMTTFAIYAMTFAVFEWFEAGMKASVDDLAVFLAYTYICGSNIQKDESFFKNYSIYKDKT